LSSSIQKEAELSDIDTRERIRELAMHLPLLASMLHAGATDREIIVALATQICQLERHLQRALHDQVTTKIVPHQPHMDPDAIRALARALKPAGERNDPRVVPILREYMRKYINFAVCTHCCAVVSRHGHHERHSESDGKCCKPGVLHDYIVPTWAEWAAAAMELGKHA
jgi:hypothetical protein